MRKVNYSIVIPAKNEQSSISSLLESIKALHPEANIIVIDDGSTDETAKISVECGVHVVSHPYSMGNGAAIKSGARAAQSEYIVFMDADGQHDPADIGKLIGKLESGFDMAVGARTADSQANIFRGLANKVYNTIASIVTGHKILDLTSGYRAVNKKLFNRFLYLLPNGFSYPTTITMAFFRSGYPISYIPIIAKKRTGVSHINPLKDGLRFFIIIIKIASLYSPLKVFTPVSVLLAILGLGNYAYTYVTDARFTNMSALLLIIAIIIFMMGLLAEQITVLTYAASERRKTDH